MVFLQNEVCLGNQGLIGKRRSIADAGLVAERLQEVSSGKPLARGDAARDAIRALQRALVLLGYSTSQSVGLADGSTVIDGQFGAGTERGLRQFQIELDLEVHGRLETSALRALDAEAAARIGTMSDDERLRQRDVLDGTISLSAADLKRLYRPAITHSATAGGVKEEVLAAIMVVESGGGGFNRPKFESHHFVALLAMHDALQGELIPEDAQVVDKLVKRVGTLPLRAGENGQTTKLSRTLLANMAGGTTRTRRRLALLAVQSWSHRQMRELASSWGWGQTMGWHTLRPAFARAQITIASLRSQDPARQIATLGAAIAIEPTWSKAAQKADASGDYSFFAEAYNGAKRGTAQNGKYTARMREAAAEYRET